MWCVDGSRLRVRCTHWRAWAPADTSAKSRSLQSSHSLSAPLKTPYPPPTCTCTAAAVSPRLLLVFALVHQTVPREKVISVYCFFPLVVHYFTIIRIHIYSCYCYCTISYDDDDDDVIIVARWTVPQSITAQLVRATTQGAIRFDDELVVCCRRFALPPSCIRKCSRNRGQPSCFTLPHARRGPAFRPALPIVQSAHIV